MNLPQSFPRHIKYVQPPISCPMNKYTSLFTITLCACLGKRFPQAGAEKIFKKEIES